MKDKITEKTKRIFILFFLVFSLFATFSILLVNSLFIKEYKDKQLSSWIDSFPSTVVNHIVESNYQPISSKLYYINKSGLFNSFVVFDDSKNVIAGFNYDLREDYELFPIKDRFSNIQGYFSYTEETVSYRFIRNLIIIDLIFLIVTAFIFNLSFNFFLKKKLLKFDEFVDTVESISTEMLKDRNDPSFFRYMSKFHVGDEILNNALIKLSNSIETVYIEKMNSKLELETAKVTEVLAKRVAHDIRSPLEALSFITKDIQNIEAPVRMILTKSVSRIRDITNNLLNLSVESKSFSVFNLKILIEDLLSEKKFERDVEIISIFSEITYEDCFIYGQETEIYRALSNLLNNAIDSQDKGQEYVEIFVQKERHTLKISIKDKGHGMDEAWLAKALNGGVSSKKLGNGIGLSSARKTIENHGGHFVITSKLKEGTCVEMMFNSYSCPDWFCCKVVLQNQIAFCLDDDLSFLELYRNKLKDIAQEIILRKEINLKEIDYYKNKDTFFFLDYDLSAGDVTGLDLIVTKDLASKSLLITSMYADEKIQNICLRYKIKIVPKQIFNNIIFSA